MKIISLVLLVIGMLLCVAGGFGTHFFVNALTNDLMRSDVAGIGKIASDLTNAWYLSFVSMLGAAFVFFGLIFNVVAMFKGKKTQ